MSEAVFDSVAATYDAAFTNSKIGSMQRSRVWHFLRTALRTEKSKLDILEINCGTGLDALWLTKEGHKVTATDLSPGMIDVAKTKSDQVDFMVAGFEDLERKFQTEKFDVIFSNFAGLNCVSGDVLAQLNGVFYNLLKPNGKLIVVLLGQKCWIERLYFTLKKRPDKARRRASYSLANIDGLDEQPTWYYSKRAFSQVFDKFKLSKARPVGLFIPPSYLEPRAKRFPILMNTLFGLEILTTFTSFFADYADHVFLSYSKA